MTATQMTHEQKVEAIIATHDKPMSFLGVYRRREAVLIAEVERLRTALREAESELEDTRADLSDMHARDC